MESGIKKIIKEKGFTLEQVASRMNGKEGKGITQSALTQMLQGDMRLSNVKQIAKIIGVSVGELLEEETSHQLPTDAKLTESKSLEIEFVCPECGSHIALNLEYLGTLDTKK